MAVHNRRSTAPVATAASRYPECQWRSLYQGAVAEETGATRTMTDADAVMDSTGAGFHGSTAGRSRDRTRTPCQNSSRALGWRRANAATAATETRIRICALQAASAVRIAFGL